MHYILRESQLTLSFKIYGPDIIAQQIKVDDPKSSLTGSVVVSTPGVVGNITEVVNLKGTITSVTNVGKLVHKVITDISLPIGRNDSFTGATLVHEDGTKYKVIGHTDGLDVAIWIERSVSKNVTYLCNCNR